MPWCPKCKIEYREGIGVCADCGSELVNEEQFADDVQVIFGDESQLLKLKKIMEGNGISPVSIKYDQTDNVYELYVHKEKLKEAQKIAGIFLRQEAFENSKMQEEECGSGEDLTAARENTSRRSYSHYQKSADKAEENKASAWVLLIFGVTGLIGVVLGIVGIIPLSLGNPYMFYGIMSAVFLLFIVMGRVSLKNAVIFAGKAESENTLQETLLKWCKENLNAEDIDNAIQTDDNDSEEVMYFKRYECIKNRLNNQFMNLDEDFLDNFIDEKVYDTIFKQ